MKNIGVAALMTAICGNVAYASTISLDLSGAVFNGAPTFQVLVDGVVVGEGALSSDGSRDTFFFEVPDESLKVGTVVSVALTNDAYEGAGRDRNLFVHRASVGSEVFDAPAIMVFRGSEMVRRGAATEAAIYSGGEVASITMNYDLNSDLAPDCTASKVISGFNNNAIDLTEKQQRQLSQLEDDLSLPNCELTVTGYGSLAGDPRTNELVSRARAQLTAVYLQEMGLKFRRVAVSGAGGTSQFGPLPSDNRVVVIELR